MFARFRDENALMGPGSAMPEASLLSDSVTHSDTDAGRTDAYHTFVLNDGRRLAWAEFGHCHGYPVLYMHRQGGCRLEALFLHDAAKAAGFRLIAVDRPGLGGSDFLSFDEPDAIADDYIQLINHLQLSRVAVFSWGGGSRFAVALAARFPERINFLNLLAPRERSCTLAKKPLLRFPLKFALRLLLSVRAGRASKDDARYIQRWREHMCYADRKQIDDPEVGSLLARIARESTRQGTAGLAQDIWFGMGAADLTGTGTGQSGMTMPVHVWNGAADTISRPYTALSPVSENANRNPRVAGVFRHWVRRQGHLFFRQAASDIFKVTRHAVGISPVVVGPLRR